MVTGTPFSVRLLLSVFLCCCCLVALLSVRNAAEVTAAFQFLVDDKPAEQVQHGQVQHVKRPSTAHTPEEMKRATLLPKASANKRRRREAAAATATTSRRRKAAAATTATTSRRRKAAAARATTRPPLESIVDGSKVIGDPQFLLDFAVLGFAKCGTTTMMAWLHEHPEAKCFPHEIGDLLSDEPATLVRRLYNKLPEGDFKRGYKSPNEIAQAHVRAHLSTYWPETRIMVGIRHPVSWFESLYNFKVNNREHVPHASKLVGPCTLESEAVCTNRGLFHVHLATLGKTNMSSPEELEMIQRYPERLKPLPPPLRNKLFLFTTDQLADSNETRSQLFAEDVQHFIGFKQKMPPIPHVRPDVKWDKKTQALKDSKKIRLCDSEYDDVRKVLMDIARPASVWIRKYFMESDEVQVSSPDYFKEILETWMHDPCDS